MYYKVRYKSGEEGILNLCNNEQVGKTYRIRSNGKIFTVIRQVNYKYTMDDIDNLRVMLEGYEYGEYYDIYQRVIKALNKGIPSIRFSSYEKELLGMLLDHEDLPYLRKTLFKIVGENNNE